MVTAVVKWLHLVAGRGTSCTNPCQHGMADGMLFYFSIAIYHNEGYNIHTLFPIERQRVTLGWDFGDFWLGKPRQKSPKSHPRVTLCLSIGKSVWILYIFQLSGSRIRQLRTTLRISMRDTTGNEGMNS